MRVEGRGVRQLEKRGRDRGREGDIVKEERESEKRETRERGGRDRVRGDGEKREEREKAE